MSTMNMPVIIDGPLPARRPFGILSVADIVSEASERWLNGGTMYGYPPGAPRLWDPCGDGSPGKDSGDAPANPSFGSVTMYFPITCTAAQVAGDPEGFVARAKLVLGAKTQFAIERQLVSGEGLATQPFLADANVVPNILGGGAVGSNEGLALLEDALVEEDGLGVIHATPSITSAWSYDKLTNDRVRLATINGTPVVSGAGYIDQVPSGQGAVSGDRQWAWGSGPIQLRLTEIEGIPDNIMEAMIVSGEDANTVTFLAERHFLVAWDTEVQVAVLIDRSI